MQISREGPVHVAMVLHDVVPGSHLVHLYADDDSLAASIAEYALDGLRRGEGVVVIAEPAHVAAVRAALEASGVRAGPGCGIHVLDSAAALAEFMEDGRPVPGRFAGVVGGALRAASAGRTGVRAYGEMVESLWRQGNVTGALALEELWNQLARELPFSLYCAYRDTLVAGATEAAALDEACRLHSRVVADGVLERRQSSTACFEADEGAPGAARAFVLAQLGPGTDRDLAGRAALIVSELATNAVRHGRGGLTVTVTPLARALRVAVRDSSPALPLARGSTPSGTHGRGLQIVGALSRAWGTAPSGGGKVIWAELDRP